MNLKHPQKTSNDEYTDPKSREIAWVPFFCLFLGGGGGVGVDFKIPVTLHLYDFDLYKTEKAHKKTREDSLQNVGNTFKDRTFSRTVSLDFSQSPFIQYLQLTSFFT